MHKTALFAAIAGLAAGLGLGSAIAAPAPPAAIHAAILDPTRAADRSIDGRRHGEELLSFIGVKPGDKVLELIPGGGYFTRLFSRVVGPRGHVYALWPNEYGSEAVSDVKAMREMGKTKAFSNVTTLEQPAKAFSAPQPLDVVFTSQNYHDYPDKFMGPTPPEVLNKAVFRALKPGGIYLIIDHAAEAGSGLRDTETLHRIDAAIVKQQVQAAGFRFEGELPVLHNPADAHTLKVFDPKVRGHTDQFVLKFRKPG